MPLIGAHVSISGGIINAPDNAAAEGCECFQIFTRSPRGGAAPPLTDAIVHQFRDACARFGLTTWVVHTPYYINLASERAALRAAGSRIIREELERASTIGAMAVMTHLGSAKDVSATEGTAHAIRALTDVLDGYTGSAQFLIEIAAGAGAVLGSTFENIAAIIAGVESAISPPPSWRGRQRGGGTVHEATTSAQRKQHHPLSISPSETEEEKQRIGVCFDTQHAFAAGYDLRTKVAVNATLEHFDRTIGLDRLKMSHIQDSKVDLGANRDRHEHVGDGAIGTDGLRAFVRHPAVANLPLILETPSDKRAQDIALLKGFRTV